ncbi:MAG: DegV family protein [Erysipelotrichaceae bacterium]|nr:DegV family protein [Erysipelotrichaceae bacterium]
MPNKKFVILSDSALDLTKKDREKYDIEFPLLGTVVYPDGSVRDADVDWVNIKPEEFYRLLSNKKNTFKTSFPNPYIVALAVEKYFQQGLDVLAVTLSGGMSGAYHAFISAAEELKEKYPDRKLLVVDSQRYSIAVGLLAVYASQLRAEGKTIDETYQWLQKEKMGLHQMGILDDLFFLYRSGRIKKIAAVAGSMIGIKPMADFSNETGRPCVLGKGRGYQKSYKLIEQYVDATIGDPQGKIFAVVNSNRPEQAERIKKIIEEKYHPAIILTNSMGEICSVNAGPGLAAVFYLGKPISKDCVEEQKLFQELLTK